jgi:hypothetical protein
MGVVMRIVAIALLSGPILSATPLAALCPEGPEDALHGIHVRYDDGSRSILRALGDGVQQDILTYQDGTGGGYTITALHGIYPLEEALLQNGNHAPGSLDVITYPEGLSSLPVPEPGLEWRASAQVSKDGRVPFERRFTVTVGQGVVATYGDCSYDVLPVALRSTDADDDGFIGMDYVPLLGISVFHTFIELGRPPDIYQPVEFHVLPNRPQDIAFRQGP